MAKFDSKTNGQTVDASEYNNIVVGLKNAIEDSGQTIDSSNTQISKAMATNAACATFYTDSGSANAYVLSSIDDLEAPSDYKDGMLIRFRPANANTGASTVNVAGLGSKDIKLSDGTTDIPSDYILTTQDTYLRFDFANDCFIANNSSNPATTLSRGVSYLPNQITIANNSTDANNDIDFSVGNFIFSDGSGQASSNSIIIKQLDASWVAGNNQGGLFSGSKANNTTYHCFMIYNPTSDTVDCGFDTSISAANIPSGYTKYKRVGSILTDGSGNIRSFTAIPMNGGVEVLYAPITETSSVPTESFANLALTMPTGLNLKAYVQQTYRDDQNPSLAITGELKSNYTGSIYYGTGSETGSKAVNKAAVWTDTSAQIQHKITSGAATLESYVLYTNGYFDPLN